jgi:cation:H+ antiporter
VLSGRTKVLRRRPETLRDIRLSDTTDVLLERFGLGQALGGLILLAIVTNLPEIAITAGASLSREFGIAVGNTLGGIAV